MPTEPGDSASLAGISLSSLCLFSPNAEPSLQYQHQLLIVATGLALDAVGQVLLVEMAVCRLGLVESVAAPVNGDDATDESLVLSAQASHGVFEEVGIVLGWVLGAADHVE